MRRGIRPQSKQKLKKKLQSLVNKKKILQPPAMSETMK